MASGTEIERDALRASDEERERVAAVLRSHAAEGRIEFEELSERLEHAYTARTRADLAALTDDLPRLPGHERSARRGDARRELGQHVAAFVAVNLVLVLIWALTGAGYFWPVWPILGWGVGVASHASETLWGVRLGFGGRCDRRHAGHRAPRRTSPRTARG